VEKRLAWVRSRPTMRALPGVFHGSAQNARRRFAAAAASDRRATQPVCFRLFSLATAFLLAMWACAP
jgi:hypothetical protein